MKLRNLLSSILDTHEIRRFGHAQLVCRRNGRHELLGGSPSDLAAAREWVSLFAHEIVFTPSRSCARRNCRQESANW